MMQSCEKEKKKAFRSKRNQNGLTNMFQTGETYTKHTSYEIICSFQASKIVHRYFMYVSTCVFYVLKKYLLINTNISTNTSTHFLQCFYFLLIPYSPNSTHQIIFLHPRRQHFPFRTKNTKMVSPAF